MRPGGGSWGLKWGSRTMWLGMIPIHLVCTLCMCHDLSVKSMDILLGWFLVVPTMLKCWCKPIVMALGMTLLLLF